MRRNIVTNRKEYVRNAYVSITIDLSEENCFEYAD